MRFKSSVKNVNTFIKFTASLSSLGKVAWVRLDNDQVRFTIIPEQGTQVWAVLAIDTIFEDYTIQSAAANNTINLEVPIAPLHRALRSAQNAISASLRLTKKDNVPLLSLTILTSTLLTTSGRLPNNIGLGNRGLSPAPRRQGLDDQPDVFYDDPVDLTNGSSRETTITQDVSVRVLSAHLVEGIHEPRCREPDVHILLPSLLQLKSISERFTKLAISAVKKPNSSGLQSGGGGIVGPGPRLELAANMHGELRLGIRTEALKIESKWKGLSNPELDPGQVEGGEEGVRDHPSTKMKGKEGEEGWAVVRVEGRDWGRVLGVGRLGGKVIACFCHEHALILYVYLPNEDPNAEESVLTYYISSYSA